MLKLYFTNYIVARNFATTNLKCSLCTEKTKPEEAWITIPNLRPWEQVLSEFKFSSFQDVFYKIIELDGEWYININLLDKDYKKKWRQWKHNAKTQKLIKAFEILEGKKIQIVTGPKNRPVTYVWLFLALRFFTYYSEQMSYRIFNYCETSLVKPGNVWFSLFKEKTYNEAVIVIPKYKGQNLTITLIKQPDNNYNYWYIDMTYFCAQFNKSWNYWKRYNIWLIWSFAIIWQKQLLIIMGKKNRKHTYAPLFLALKTLSDCDYELSYHIFKFCEKSLLLSKTEF